MPIGNILTPQLKPAHMKKVLIEPANDEELKMIEAFIQEHKMKGFIVEDSKANTADVLNDVIRVFTPLASL